jgi:hypothetical protein
MSKDNGEKTSELQVNLNEQMQKIGATISEYKDKLVTTFKE